MGLGTHTTVLNLGWCNWASHSYSPWAVWSLSELYQGAHPSFWAEGPIGCTFQQALFYRPHWITQGHQTLQLFRTQETC